MIPLDLIKSTPAGKFFIYEAPGRPGEFYSGITLAQQEGITRPLYLRLVPTDKRLPPFYFVNGDGRVMGGPKYLVRELAFNQSIAFHVSEADLRGSRDLRQDLLAQARGTDLSTELAVDYLLRQLPEVRRNFAPPQK